MTTANGPVEPMLSHLRSWADLLDSRFRIPGTDVRLGIDPILSLLPGVGDLASPVFAVVLMVQGVRQRVPKVILGRMMINALGDAVIGAVPVAGLVGDIFWRANLRNLDLLERYARPGATPSPFDQLVVWGLVALFGIAAYLQFVLAVWMMASFLRVIGVL